MALRKDGKVIAEAVTDFFGDFKFDGLKPESGSYVVEVSQAANIHKTVDVELQQSVYLGDIYI